MNIADGDSLIPLTPQMGSILLALAEKPQYGYAISQQAEVDSKGVILMSAGSLYPGLNRLEAMGYIEPAGIVKATSSPYKRRLYRLTLRGREILEMETNRQAEFVGLARYRLIKNKPI